MIRLPDYQPPGATLIFPRPRHPEVDSIYDAVVELLGDDASLEGQVSRHEIRTALVASLLADNDAEYTEVCKQMGEGAASVVLEHDEILERHAP